ncbi:hypothetical protein ACTVCO_07320 [Sanguibacter sp. A247]|uniref:hypothetical protein n=1 Tax=unclassified Sanguibacter TaxID=2645534 RepID=UPI003FD7BA5A
MLALFLVWVVPIAAVAMLLPRAAAAEVASTAVRPPTVVRVGEVEDARRSAVRIEVRRNEPRSVSVRRAGIVTKVHVGVDETIKSGDAIVSIDGVKLVAFMGESPMFRDIGPRTQGEDVRALGTFLAAMELLPVDRVSESYSSALGAAICEFQKASGTTCDRIFAADSVLFVAEQGATVATVHAVLGDDVVSGEPVVDLEAAVESVVIVPEAPSSRLVALEGREVELTAANGERLRLPDVWVEAEFRDSVAQFVAAHARVGAADGRASTYDGVTVSLAEAERRGTVPSSAVHVSEAGAPCVFVVHGEQYVATPVDDVRAMPGLGGALAVPPGLAGEDVVRAPSQTLPIGVLASCR